MTALSVKMNPEHTALLSFHTRTRQPAKDTEKRTQVGHLITARPTRGPVLQVGTKQAYTRGLLEL